MFRPIWIPQKPPAVHPPKLRDRGSHTTDGTAAFFSSIYSQSVFFIIAPLGAIFISDSVVLHAASSGGRTIGKPQRLFIKSDEAS